MVKIIGKKPDDLKGEKVFWEFLEKNLEEECIVYHNKLVNDARFDYLVVAPDQALFLFEVKGWNKKHVKEVVVRDNTCTYDHKTDLSVYAVLDDSDKKTEKYSNPKNQVDRYLYNLSDLCNDIAGIEPLIINFVCYPFISEKSYYELNLDKISENKYTIFEDDLKDENRFFTKLAEAFEANCKKRFAKPDSDFIRKLRSYYEIDESSALNKSKDFIYYSQLEIINEDEDYSEEIVKKYFEGTKFFLFTNRDDIYKSIITSLIRGLLKNNIWFDRGDLIYKISECRDVGALVNEYSSKESFKIFNFEIYLIDKEYDPICIINGNNMDKYSEILEKLDKSTDFNYSQFSIEHGAKDKDLMVSAGAGTGKTYTMISRIAFLCLNNGNTVNNISDDIAMITFTNDAVDNMRQRIKQCFINYYILTRERKFLVYVEKITDMFISTIHSFGKEVMRKASFSLGLGEDFSYTSSIFERRRIYTEKLEEYININSVEFENYPLRPFELTKILMDFSDKLYNKSINIKDFQPTQFGSIIGDNLSNFNSLIQSVIIPAEIEYLENTRNNNSVDLKEAMIVFSESIIADQVSSENIPFKYLFIDEFQDTDDVQIELFAKLKEKLGYHFFVVGDIKQSIYRFRGAKTIAFERLKSLCGEWIHYELQKNYRTDNRLLEEFHKKFTKISQQQINDEPYLPYKEKDRLIGKENILIKDNEWLKSIEYHRNDQMDLLFKEIDFQYDKLSKEDSVFSGKELTIAILVRDNWQIDKIVKEAKNRKLRYQIETDNDGELYQSLPVIDLYKLIMALANPCEPVYLVNFILSNYVKCEFNYFKLYSKDKKDVLKYCYEILNNYFTKKLSRNWLEIISLIQKEPVLKIVKEIINACTPWIYLESHDQALYKSNLELAIEKVIDKYSTDYLTLNRLEKTLNINITTRQKAQSRKNLNPKNSVRVICTTIHKSKGLEYGTVILAYTNNNLDTSDAKNMNVIFDDTKNSIGYRIPFKAIDSGKPGNLHCQNTAYDSAQEQFASIMEGARVLYVAMTRAIHSFVWLYNVNTQSKESITMHTLLSYE